MSYASAMRQPAVRDTLASLRNLAILCVAVPLAVYAAVGVFRYQQIRDESEVRVARTLRIAHEHALKVLDTTEALHGRILDAVQRADTGDLRQREQALHSFLSAMVKDKPQIQSIWILGPDGRPVATSRFFPAPALNFSDRDYFKFHQGGSSDT